MNTEEQALLKNAKLNKQLIRQIKHELELIKMVEDLVASQSKENQALQYDEMETEV